MTLHDVFALLVKTLNTLLFCDLFVSPYRKDVVEKKRMLPNVWDVHHTQNPNNNMLTR